MKLTKQQRYQLKILRLLQARLVQKIGDDIIIRCMYDSASGIFFGNKVNLGSLGLGTISFFIVPLFVKSIARAKYLSPVGHNICKSLPYDISLQMLISEANKLIEGGR